MSEQILKPKCYKTTLGKVGIFVGIAAIVTISAILISKSKKKSNIAVPDVKKDDVKQTDAKIENSQNSTVGNMPYGVCEQPILNHDKVYNYVRCNGIWHTISKDTINGKIKQWTSLENNKTATTLLNEKYPKTA